MVAHTTAPPPAGSSKVALWPEEYCGSHTPTGFTARPGRASKGYSSIPAHALAGASSPAARGNQWKSTLPAVVVQAVTVARLVLPSTSTTVGGRPSGVRSGRVATIEVNGRSSVSVPVVYTS